MMTLRQRKLNEKVTLNILVNICQITWLLVSEVVCYFVLNAIYGIPKLLKFDLSYFQFSNATKAL